LPHRDTGQLQNPPGETLMVRPDADFPCIPLTRSQYREQHLELPDWPVTEEEEISVHDLFTRLVAGTPKPSTNWQENVFRDTSLRGWNGFSDGQLDVMRRFLHPVRFQPMVSIDPDKDLPSDDDDADFRPDGAETEIPPSVPAGRRFPRKPPQTQFNTRAVSARTAGLFCALTAKPEWIEAESYRQQVHVAIVDLCHKGHCPQTEVARLFGKNRGTIQRTFEKSLEDPRSIGRPTLLDDSKRERLFAFVRERFASAHPATYEDLLDFCDDKLEVNLLPNTLRHIVLDSKEVRVITGVPMEKERVACDPAEVDRFYEAITRAIANTPASLVFNCDEAGFQEWADKREVSVIVPNFYKGEKIEMPIDRSTKRCSLLGCICADGSTLKPLMIVARKTSEIELYEIGYTPDRVTLKFQESGFMNTSLFEQWMMDEFLPSVRTRRARLGYTGPAFLILDGMSAHDSDWFFLACDDAGVVPIFLPPHSSDQTQALDLGIFGVQKTAMGRVHPPEWLTTQTQILAKILGAWQAVTTPPNIISAFSQMGLSIHWDYEHNCNCVTVQRQLARKLRSPRTDQELKDMKKRLPLGVGEKDED
jgi:hypothetical protein